MRELVVFGCKKRYEAEAVLCALENLEKEAVIDIEDSAVVEKTLENEVKIQPQGKMSGQFSIAGALYFGLLGGVAGWIISGTLGGATLFGLQAGALIGAISGALAKELVGVGVPPSLAKKLAASIETGTSALIVSIRGSVTSGRVLESLKGAEAQVLQTSLQPPEEAKLKAALAARN